MSRALRADSSRTSQVAAGWPNAGRCHGEYVTKAKDGNFPRRFSWLRPRVLLESRNHVLADLVRRANTDIVNDERMRWVAAQRTAGVDTDFVIDRTDLGASFSFLAVGDPGEGDSSQYVVVPHLLAQEDTAFALIVSDVIYPTGENNDYPDGFYRPYREYRRQIYALPGNHDWYSLLTGFMWNFCGVEPLTATTERLSSYSWQERLARFMWLRPRKPAQELLRAYRDERWRIGRPDGEAAPHQTGPYFAIQAQSVLIVCIDTGTSGSLDREQGEWLLRMARRPGRKLLFTGRPIWVNGDHHPCDIKWLPTFTTDEHPERTADPAPKRTGDEPVPPPYETVDKVLRDPEFGFVGAIGGDVHNYQRYPGPLQYIVSGGGGAFMSPTHTIEDLDRISQNHPELNGLAAEADFRLYPLRGDSMARFARGSRGRLWRLLGYVAAVSLVLWFLTLQVWNPRDAGVFQWANVSPDWSVWVVSPLSWLPSDGDYDRWAAVAVGGLAVAAGLGLLLLPWFDWRVKGALAVVAAGTALLAWHGALLELPAGDHSYLAGVVGAIAVPILAIRQMREIRGWHRIGIALALFITAALMADWSPTDSNWWDVGREVAVLAGVSILLVGGPRLGLKARFIAAGAILALTGLLYVLNRGWSGALLLVLAVLATLFLLYAFGLLFAVLFDRRELDPDQAARFMASAQTNAVRAEQPPKPGFLTRWKLNALRPGWHSRFLYPAETLYSALFDYNDQPFFKSFLRIDVDGDELKLYCFGVVEETVPATVEDHVRWDGKRWTEARAILGAGAAIVVGEVDWFEGPELVFHLGEEAVGRRFTVVFADDGDWRPVGELEYRGTDEPWLPEEPHRPRRIGLEHAGELYAEGAFV